MPSRTKNSSEPPPVMTWPKAAPVLVVAVIFDALRLMFLGFVFFGPALLAFACTTLAGGSTATGLLCTSGAAAVGIYGVPVFIGFGIVMAMIVGFAGWLVVGIILFMFNRVIFKENALWFMGSLAASEVPFVNAVPFTSLFLAKMYSNQIKKEKADRKKYEAGQAAFAEREARERALASRAVAQRERQAYEEQAANDEMYEAQAENDSLYETQVAGRAARAQASNDAMYGPDGKKEIPDNLRRAA